MDAKKFVELNLRPDPIECDLVLTPHRTAAEIAAMTMEEVLDGTFEIVCANAAWAVWSTNAKGVRQLYSGDGSGVIWLATENRRGMVKYTVGDDRLHPRDSVQFVFADDAPAVDLAPPGRKQDSSAKTPSEGENKEDIIMTDDNQDLGALLGNVTSEAGVPPMNIFGDGVEDGDKRESDPKAKEKKTADERRAESEAQMAKIMDAIEEAGGADIDMSIATSVWRDVARVIGFVTSSDKRHKLSAVKVSTKSTERELVEGAPDSVKQLAKTDMSQVPAEYIKSLYVMKAAENKPSPILGVVVRVPMFLKDKGSADVYRAACTDDAKLARDKGDKATVTEVMKIADFNMKLRLLGGRVTEADETKPMDGNAGELEVLVEARKETVEKAAGKMKKKTELVRESLVKVGTGSRNVLHDNNYFPLTTYETVDLSDETQLDDETVDRLNMYHLKGLFTPQKNKPASFTKHANLDGKDQPHIKTSAGKITSDYITRGANRVDMTVGAFYDKNKARGSLQLPKVAPKVKSDGSEGDLGFISYSVLEAAKMEDESYRQKTSLGLPQFANMVEVVGSELLSPSKLRAMFKRAGTAKKVQKGLSEDVSRKMAILELSGKKLSI